MIVSSLEKIWKWPHVYAFYQTAFSDKKDFGQEERRAAWAAEQRTLHGHRSAEIKIFPEKGTFRDISIMAEEAKRRAEIARLAFLLKLTKTLNYKGLRSYWMFGTSFT